MCLARRKPTFKHLENKFRFMSFQKLKQVQSSRFGFLCKKKGLFWLSLINIHHVKRRKQGSGLFNERNVRFMVRFFLLKKDWLNGAVLFFFRNWRMLLGKLQSYLNYI